MTSAALALRLALVLAAAAAPAPATAQLLFTWPGPFPCSGTLQDCVNAAGPDDGVEIATNGPIAESIHKSGSLDLTAAPGFTPVFTAGHSISASALGTEDAVMRVRGLTLTDGRIILGNVGTGSLNAQVLDNTILAFGVFSAIAVTSSGGGPLVFRIEGNDVSPSVGADSAIRVFVQQGFGMGDVTDNVARMPANPDAVGILLELEDGALVPDVVGNRVEGDGYGYGIRTRLFDVAVLDARVMGNLVTGATGNGAAISTESALGVDKNVLVVNNTLVGNADGVLVQGVNGIVANNILASTADLALSYQSAGGSNRNNLFFANTFDIEGSAFGPDTVFGDPRFAGAIDFRLAAGSPAIDAGVSSARPPELDTDLAGAPRIQGEAVDIGAYEAPEPAAALGGFAALLTLALRARRALPRAGGGRPHPD